MRVNSSYDVAKKGHILCNMYEFKCVCVLFFYFSFAQSSWCSAHLDPKFGNPLLWLSSETFRFLHLLFVTWSKLDSHASDQQISFISLFGFLFFISALRFGPLIPFYCRLVVSCVKTLLRSCIQWLCGCERAAVDCLRGRGHIVFFLISRRIFCLWLRPDQLWKTHSVLTDDAHKKTTLIYLRHVHIFILQPLNRWIDIYQSLTFVVRSQFGYISRQNLSVRFRKRSLFGLE